MRPAGNLNRRTGFNGHRITSVPGERENGTEVPWRAKSPPHSKLHFLQRPQLLSPRSEPAPPGVPKP